MGETAIGDIGSSSSWLPAYRLLAVLPLKVRSSTDGATTSEFCCLTNDFSNSSIFMDRLSRDGSLTISVSRMARTFWMTGLASSADGRALDRGGGMGVDPVLHRQSHSAH